MTWILSAFRVLRLWLAKKKKEVMRFMGIANGQSSLNYRKH